MPFGNTFGALGLSSVKDLMLQRAWPQCLQADFLELFLGVFFEVLFWRCVLFGAAGFHVADFETQKTSAWEREARLKYENLLSGCPKECRHCGRAL